MFNKENFGNFVTKSDSFKETDEMKNITENSREKILDFQEEKELLINQMHELLKKSDNGEEIYMSKSDDFTEIFKSDNEQRDYEIQYMGKNKKDLPALKKAKITKGDIAIASIWNKDLKLNSNINRKTKKEFILRETKRKISGLWDKQLTVGAKDSNETNTIQSFSGLEKSAEAEEKQNYEKMSGGHLAEKMVNSFFTKILENNSDLPFTMEQADVFDDAMEKIDFYFHIKQNYVRGLSINSCEENINENCNEIKDIGIQYTMNNSKQKQEQKEKQIEKSKKRNSDKIEDLILVTVPLKNLHKSLDDWKKDNTKNNFSGPERFLSDGIKEKLFKSMLENLPDYLDINAEEYWDKIKDQV